MSNEAENDQKMDASRDEKPFMQTKFSFPEALQSVISGSFSPYAFETIFPLEMPDPSNASPPALTTFNRYGDESSDRSRARLIAGYAQRPIRHFNPRRTNKRLVEKRRRVREKLTEPKPLGDGTVAAGDVFSYGDHQYFKLLVDTLWCPAPIGAEYMSEMINRIALQMEKIVSDEKARLITRNMALVNFEFVSSSTANEVERKGAQNFEAAFQASDDVSDFGKALKLFKAKSYAVGDLSVADMSGLIARFATDRDECSEAASMALELALMMITTRMCNKLLMDGAGRGPVSMPKEHREKISQAMKRVSAEHQRLYHEAKARGASPQELAAIPVPSLKGIGRKRGPRPGQPGYVERPRGRPRGTGKHQIAAAQGKPKIEKW